jgi:hypothetical protein
MRYFTSILLTSLLLAPIAVAIPTQAQVNPSTSSKVALTEELSPFNLAYLAYQGNSEWWSLNQCSGLRSTHRSRPHAGGS